MSSQAHGKHIDAIIAGRVEMDVICFTVLTRVHRPCAEERKAEANDG